VLTSCCYPYPYLDKIKKLSNENIMRDIFGITIEIQEAFSVQNKVIGFFMINLTSVIVKGLAANGILFDIP
jgi:hypothetical protein